MLLFIFETHNHLKHNPYMLSHHDLLLTVQFSMYIFFLSMCICTFMWGAIVCMQVNLHMYVHSCEGPRLIWDSFWSIFHNILWVNVSQWNPKPDDTPISLFREFPISASSWSWNYRRLNIPSLNLTVSGDPNLGLCAYRTRTLTIGPSP